MTQVPDDTPNSLVDDDIDEVQNQEQPTPDDTSRDFRQSGTDSDPASYLNP